MITLSLAQMYDNFGDLWVVLNPSIFRSWVTKAHNYAIYFFGTTNFCHEQGLYYIVRVSKKIIKQLFLNINKIWIQKKLYKNLTRNIKNIIPWASPILKK